MCYKSVVHDVTEINSQNISNAWRIRDFSENTGTMYRCIYVIVYMYMLFTIYNILNLLI